MASQLNNKTLPEVTVRKSPMRSKFKRINGNNKTLVKLSNTESSAKPKLGTLEDLANAAAIFRMNDIQLSNLPSKATTGPDHHPNENSAKRKRETTDPIPVPTIDITNIEVSNNTQKQETGTAPQTSKSLYVKTHTGPMTRVDLLAVPIPKEIMTIMKECKQLKKENNTLERRLALAKQKISTLTNSLGY